MKNILRRGLYGLVGLIAAAGIAVGATNLTFSFGQTWVPSGPALFAGSDFQVLTNAVETLRDQADGTTALTGNTVTSTSATTCLSAGPNGTTGPTFNVDCSVASEATGVGITGAASGSGATIAVTGGTNESLSVNPKGTGVVKVGGAIATCTGTTTATCAGQRMVVSVTGLTTAASTAAAAMTVTATSVASSASIVMCQPNGYAGTGLPVITTLTPGTGSFSFVIQNVSTGAALNATVPVACFVFGT